MNLALESYHQVILPSSEKRKNVTANLVITMTNRNQLTREMMDAKLSHIDNKQM